MCCSEYSSIKQENENLKKDFENASQEVALVKDTLIQKDEEIMTLKENLQSSGLNHGHREEDMKQKIKELEGNCRGMLCSFISSYFGKKFVSKFGLAAC